MNDKMCCNASFLKCWPAIDITVLHLAASALLRVGRAGGLPPELPHPGNLLLHGVLADAPTQQPRLRKQTYFNIHLYQFLLLPWRTGQRL